MSDIWTMDRVASLQVTRKALKRPPAMIIQGERLRGRGKMNLAQISSVLELPSALANFPPAKALWKISG